MSTIIVTGDSGGLGKAVVLRLLKEGYKVLGISRRITKEMEFMMKEFKDRYFHISFDLQNVEKIGELYHNDIKQFGPIYGLVNNSALAYDDIITNARIENIEKMFKVNLFSAMMLTKYVIRDMLLHEVKGSLVHISSVSAHTGYKGLSMYAASKAALEAFSKSIAREWGAKGIRSNCVAPGFMETAMSSTLTPEQKMRIYNRTSLRKATDVQSVADTVLFLISEKSNSITGTTIHVDCGTI